MGNGAPAGSSKPGTPTSIIRINSFPNLDISHNEHLVDQLRQGTPPHTMGLGGMMLTRGAREDRTGAGPRPGNVSVNNTLNLPSQISSFGMPGGVRRAVNLSEVVPEDPDSENYEDFAYRKGSGQGQNPMRTSNYLNLTSMNKSVDMSMQNVSGIPRSHHDSERKQDGASTRRKNLVSQKREPCKNPADTYSQQVFFDENQVKRLKKKFEKLDVDNQGSLTLAQFGNLREIHSHSFSERIMELTEDRLNAEKKKRMSFDDFLQVLSIFHPKCSAEKKYVYAFRMYDINADNIVDLADLTEMLKKIFSCREMSLLDQGGYDTVFANEPYVEEMANAMMMQCDPNGNKSLAFAEFQSLILEGDFEAKMIINF